MTLYINNSLLSMLNRCETETWVRWGRELVMREQQGVGPREVGSVLHVIFEAYFNGFSKTECMLQLDQAWTNVIGTELPKQERLYQSNVSRVVAHWLDAMALRPRDWTVIATEKLFEVPLGTINGEEVIYYGTPDMLIEWKGDLWVVDNKTTGSIDEDWAQSWQMSAQLQGYVWGYRAQGYKVKGAFVNGLEVNRLPPWDGNMEKKCSTHKLKYKECQAAHIRHQWVGPLWWSEARLYKWHADAVRQIRQLQWLRDTDDVPAVKMDGQFKWPGCNGGRGRPSCQYRGWCQANRPVEGLTQLMIPKPWREAQEVEVE